LGKDYKEDHQQEDGVITPVTGANSAFLLMLIADRGDG